LFVFIFVPFFDGSRARSEHEQRLQADWEANSFQVYGDLLQVVIRKFTADSHFPLVVRPEGRPEMRLLLMRVCIVVSLFGFVLCFVWVCFVVSDLLAAFFSMVQCSKLIGRKVPDEVKQLNGTVVTGLRQYVKTETFQTVRGYFNLLLLFIMIIIICLFF
jgi:hypothetical protein